MIENSDITVVVQGPVQALPHRDQDEGITRTCLSSIRRFLPGAWIILSTWPDQNLAGLDFDELIVSADPGANIIGYRKDGSPMLQNYNRQIVSSREGLKRVKTPYAIKLRADNYLTGCQFKALQQAYPKRCNNYRLLHERVVVNNTFTREYAKGMPVAFHLCDFFYFGKTEDVLDIWDIDLFPDFVFDPRRSGKSQYQGAPRFTPDATQRLWLRAINKHLKEPVVLKHIHDTAGGKKLISDICYANNLIVGTPADIGLGLPGKFLGKERAASAKSLLSYMDHTGWQRLYKRHCDPEYSIPGATVYVLHTRLRRYFYLFGKRVEARLRLLKNRLQYIGG